MTKSLRQIKEVVKCTQLNDLTYSIRGTFFKVHSELGPGLLESVYEAALMYELRSWGLSPENQVPLPVVYKDVRLDLGFKIDIWVERRTLVEIKSVDTLHDVHKKQTLTYLKLSNTKVGFLVNFNVNKLIDKENLIRIIN